MIKSSNKKSRMVYTPEFHIPVGEAVMTESGEYGLRIKKPKGSEYEVISLGKLMTAVSQKVTASV